MAVLESFTKPSFCYPAPKQIGCCQKLNLIANCTIRGGAASGGSQQKADLGLFGYTDNAARQIVYSLISAERRLKLF